ncbi:MAG: putative protein YccU [Candidatus Erwinia impunctatus]|nr:putative protein YccU [Culicoides impunctatus]
MQQDQNIAAILHTTHHIALVGASDNAARASYQVMKWLLEQGYQVTPVNPKLAGTQLLGQRVYGQLADIPDPVDMVDVFRASDAAVAIAQEAINIGAKVLWLQLGVINAEAANLAEKAGLTVVMDRCPKIEIPRLGVQTPVAN